MMVNPTAGPLVVWWDRPLAGPLVAWLVVSLVVWWAGVSVVWWDRPLVDPKACPLAALRAGLSAV